MRKERRKGGRGVSGRSLKGEKDDKTEKTNDPSVTARGKEGGKEGRREGGREGRTSQARSTMAYSMFLIVTGLSTNPATQPPC